jgi:hypothetical protein
LHRVAERIEGELGEEQFQFIEGCPRDWAKQPPPGPPLTVGLDGGYVHASDQKSRAEGWFEVIAGKSVQTEGGAKVFAFVNKYDTKPKRRLYEVLRSQGLQMNQQVVFLSDGGDTVRDLQTYLSPESEHLLDWFHVTMRLPEFNLHLRTTDVLVYIHCRWLQQQHYCQRHRYVLTRLILFVQKAPCGWPGAFFCPFFCLQIPLDPA